MPRFEPLELEGLVLVTPDVHGDARGFFMERWKRSAYAAYGIDADFVQDNHSRSGLGVLRGLHWQRTPHAQGKLVSVVSGEIFDVGVDLRRGSPTFGHWAGAVLSEANHQQLWVPPGFAHGFVVRSDTADVLYKTSGEYDRDSERGLHWDDPAIGIDWGQGPFQLSERDRDNPSLHDLDVDDLFEDDLFEGDLEADLEGDFEADSQGDFEADLYEGEQQA